MIIEQGAHSCNAYQTNRNILLSDHARAQSVPNLEILTTTRRDAATLRASAPSRTTSSST